MRVAKLYDKLSSHYSDFDYYDIHAKSSHTLLECIEEAKIFSLKNQTDDLDSNAMQMVDLGAGDGRFLEAFHAKYPHVKLTGLDISPKMLELAQQKIDFHTINAGIEQAGLHLSENTFNLATANFVCAYVGLYKVLEQAKKTLKPKGYICIATSTFESFKSTQQQVSALAKSFNPFKRFVGVTLKNTFNSALVPVDFQDIANTAQNLGFNIKARKHLMTELNFDDGDIFLETAMRGGWIVTLFEQLPLPSKMIYWLAKLLVHTFQFPFKDKCIVEVVMLQKDE